MKRILIILAVLFALGAGLGLLWHWDKFSAQPAPQTTLSEGSETAVPDSATATPVDPAEGELSALLSDYNVRKTDVGYLQLVSEMLLERRQVTKAKKYLDEAYTIDPLDARTVSLLAKVALLKKDFEQAELYLASLPDDDIHTAFIKALTAVLTGNRDTAGKHLHYITDNFPESDLAKKSQRIIDAYREFDYYRDGLPLHLKTLLARSLNQIDEPALAIWLLRDVLTEKTDYRDAWILLGYAYYNLQQFSLAEDAFRKAYELDTEKPETQYFLGLTYYALNNLPESARFFEYAVVNGFEPKTQVYQKLSEVYVLEEEFQKAVSMYENYLALAPETHPEDFVRPVFIYIEYLQAPANALVLAQKVVTAHPDKAMSYTLLGWAYAANDDFTNALVNLEKARIMDATLPYLSLAFGKFYEAKGEIEKAKEYYKEAYDKNDLSVRNEAAESYNVLLEQDQQE